jgi:hypothetical protein
LQFSDNRCFGRLDGSVRRGGSERRAVRARTTKSSRLPAFLLFSQSFGDVTGAVSDWD